MDRRKLSEAREHLEYLDDRLTYRVRPAAGGSMTRPSSDELERRLRELAEYTLEIKEVLQRLIEALDGDEGQPVDADRAPDL